MIRCGCFYDSAADRWNAKVLADPAVNITCKTEQDMKDGLPEVWNQHNPDQPATAEDFTYQETSPW